MITWSLHVRNLFRMKYPRDFILLGIAIILFTVATYLTVRERERNHARNIATTQHVDSRVLLNNIAYAMRENLWTSWDYMHLDVESFDDILSLKHSLGDNMYQSIKHWDKKYSIFTTNTMMVNTVCVWGCGPDGRYDVTGHDVAANLNDLGVFTAFYAYDVTNGAMSAGDILHWRSDRR